MARSIAVIVILATVAASGAAFAQVPSGYGTEGPYGQRLHYQAQSSNARDWNQGNEARWRAEKSARRMSRHGQSFPNPL